MSDLVGMENLFNLFRRALRPQIGFCHLAAAQSRRHRGRQRRPDRHAVVAGGRLNKYPVHQSPAEKQPVSLGVERHSSGKADIFASSERNGMAYDSKFRPLAGILHGPGDIDV